MQPYLKSAQILVCPSDSASVKVASHPIYGANATRSYTATGQVMGNLGASQNPLSLSAIPATALTVMIAEDDNTTLTTNWYNDSYANDLGVSLVYRHLETANFLYCDGHVKAQKGKAGGPYPNLSGYSLTGTSANCVFGATLPQ